MGCVPERAFGRTRLQVRRLWIQGAIYDKVVRLKVKGTDNEADMGTKDLDRPTHQRLLQKLLGLIATVSGGSVVEARMSGNEEALGKFSAQMMVVTLTALVTWVLMEALKQIDATALGKTVERGTQTELTLPPVGLISICSYNFWRRSNYLLSS